MADDKRSDEDFARAFAPLFEVMQRGEMRPATPADVLELLGTGGRRYVLKGLDGRYIAGDGSGWTRRQRRAAVVDDLDDARAMKRLGLQQYGVRVKIVRIRRKGTCGVEAIRLRPDIATTFDGDRVGLGLKPEDVMNLMAVMSRAKGGEGEQ